MSPDITVASTDNLVQDYEPYHTAGEWVSKVADHVRYIYGSNYNVSEDSDLGVWDDIKDLDDKCEVAQWYHNSDLSNGSNHVHLLLLSNLDWSAGCTVGSENIAACTAAVGDDLFDVPSPYDLGTFYAGYGYGSGMLNACIHEIGHCWGMSYNDGYVCPDYDEELNHRSPMAGKPTEDTNNCGTNQYKYDSYYDAYLHGYYDPCETSELPAGITEDYTKSAFPSNC